MEPKFEYTLNNHFKWGYGDEWHNRPDPTKQFKIMLGSQSRPLMSFRDECIEAARLIGERATKPIIVGLSGGSDSQIACLAFREAKVPFSVVIVRMFDKDNNHINDFDIKTAYEFCRVYNIDYIEHSINVDEFYRGQGSEYAARYAFTHPNVIVQASTMDFVGPDYCYIMAGGDIVFCPYKSGMTPDLQLPRIPNVLNGIVNTPVWWYGTQPIMQHMIESGFEGTSKFFMYTPELLLSFLKDPVVRDFINAVNPIYEVYISWSIPENWWKCFQMLIKPMVTMREWPEMIPARKYTGFEMLDKARSENSNISMSKMYHTLLLEAAKEVQHNNQLIATTMPDLIKYLETPHDHPLVSTRLVR